MPRNLFMLILCAFFLYASAARDAQAFDEAGFSDLPVLHDGRIKPMDSFARSLLKQFSGTDRNAIPWLLETLFNPANAENMPVLKVTNPDLLNMLELSRQPAGLYTYKDLSGALNAKQEILVSILKTPDADWTPAQKDFVLLQQKTVLLGDLLASLSLYLPFSVQVPQSAPRALKAYAGRTLTYLDVFEFHEALQKEVKKIVKVKGQDIGRYSESEQALTMLSFHFDNLRFAGKRSTIFKAIPAGAQKLWMSPWENHASGEKNPAAAGYFKLWQDMAEAYHHGDKAGWESGIREIKVRLADSPDTGLRPLALIVERVYNDLHPFYASAALYAISLALFAFGYWRKKDLLTFCFYCLGAGFTVHAAGIAARMYILERPPVSTLYESIIFVALIAAGYGLARFKMRRDMLALGLGAGAALFLNFLSFSHNQEGDSMLMLSAVLNTNFWLATHVVCITAGYAFCLITSLLAHAALWRRTPDLQAQMHFMALLSLLFAAVGTVLGGIWADQSWGRFWGWDPKENGALLIVLWLIWLLHGRISGTMRELYVTAGLAYLSVIVALSWFGVNLLSVGLHAYGFTDAAAGYLAAVIAFETVFIGWLMLRSMRGVHNVQ